MIRWVGTIAGICGGVLIALNIAISKYAFLIFLVSSVSWLIQGYKNKDNALVLLNIVFIIIDLIGIYRWLI